MWCWRSGILKTLFFEFRLFALIVNPGIVDESVFDQGSKNEHDAGTDPDIDGFGVRDRWEIGVDG